MASTIGEGSTLAFYLPASTAVSSARPTDADRITAGSGRILVMDDETDIREISSTALQMAGYEVDAVENGHEAVLRYHKALDEGNPYRAVIFDLTIPGAMGGLEAMKILKEMDPKIRGIVSSGYSHDPVMADPTAHGFAGAIHKPFKISQLTERVKMVLSSGS